MDAHNTVVLLDSDQYDGETAETGGARRSARGKRPRTGLDGGMLSSVVILDGAKAIVRPSQWTLVTLSELGRRASVKDGERLLLFFTRSSHHALVAIESVAGATWFMHLCSLGRPLPVDVEATLARFGARDQNPRGCPRQQNGLDCGFFVLALTRYVVALTTPLSAVRRIPAGAVDKVTDAYIAQQRQWLRGLSEE